MVLGILRNFAVQDLRKGFLIGPLVALLALAFGAGPLTPPAIVVQAQENGRAESLARLQEQDRLVVYIQAEGPLTPAMVSYVRRGLRIAQNRGAVALIFRLDTPGGQIDLTQDIVTALRESQTPVVVYVAPRGAAAWSAGTFITLAGHAAAMAPETGIGAASPVSMSEVELSETAERKAKEAVRSMVRDLAARRGEEVLVWTEAAVEDAVAATASEAYEMGLVDFVADDLDDLLTQLDGFTVHVRGEQVVLRTAGARVVRVSMSLIERILHIVVNPTIILTLLGIGVQAILIEISSPGGWVAGFVGIVCIALGVYGLGVLPVNGLGLIFVALAVGLFIMDIKAPTHGALTAAGVASMVAGAMVLFNSGDAPQYARISLPVVITITLCFAGTSLFIMTKALQAQRPRPKTGVEGLMGAIAEVRADLDPKGTVLVQGERWHAVAEDGPIAIGEQVEIVAVEGFCLRVKRKE
jgi:membrane-bound serine protease (ClpP class)